MKLEELCPNLSQYIAGNKIFRTLQPFAVPGLLVCVGIQLVGTFISFGSLIYTASFIAFWAFSLLVLSDCNFQVLSIGFALMTFRELGSLMESLFRYKYLAYGTLIYVLLYGYFAYAAYRKHQKL